ncbi:MAG: biotin--[acetyl-CoA-carboxylase] ligase [Planctomycetaceae bacterium]|nr:biotin--[acetyl-CoA-carboxylase] ligase [Planctomycetaceae bacterium]
MITIRTIEYYDCISSTNDHLKEILKQSVLPKLPYLVVARRQTAGRGRGHKVWWSGEGALAMSLALELETLSLKRTDLPLFSLAAGLAVLKTIRNRLPENNVIGLHLPNDVYVDGKKISGILIESPTPQHLVLGVGINVNNRLNEIPPEFRNEFQNKPITSFIEILNETTDISVLIVDFLIMLSGELNRITAEPLEIVRDAEKYCVAGGGIPFRTN